MGNQTDVLKSLGEYKIIEYKSEGRLLVKAGKEIYIVELDGSILKEMVIENPAETSLLAKESGKRFTITREGRIFKEITIEELMTGPKKS